MPAEWYPHEATWLSWPTDPATWPDRLQPVRQTYLEIISLLNRAESIHLLVDDEAIQEEVQTLLEQKGVRADSIFLHRIPTSDAWIRDYGPNFIVRQEGSVRELAFNDWVFNAWGNKYPELILDTWVPSQIRALLGVQKFDPGMVLEGGSIEVNGRGICLTTEQCLLNPNRNPDLGKEDITRRLKDFLGVDRVIWLAEGITGDDTDGHIDDIVRFTDEHTVLCAVEEDPSDDNYLALKENFNRLQSLSEKTGWFRVKPLVMPEPVVGSSDRLPASYANFYIANEIVLVPVFRQPRDQRALNTIQNCFPSRQVVPLFSGDLVWGLGAIHCLTQQQPAAGLLTERSFLGF